MPTARTAFLTGRDLLGQEIESAGDLSTRTRIESTRRIRDKTLIQRGDLRDPAVVASDPQV